MESDSERDERIMSLLEEALKRPPQEREAFVRAKCERDPALLDEVMEALVWEERMGNFMRQPLIDSIVFRPPFEPGQVIAERFEIVREIGEGGMGVVYEANDRKRQQRIAIKAAKPGFQRLLSPELEGALKVRHHNICLVNEIHTAQTIHGDIDFLTMELLCGRTLTARIAECGRLEHEEALSIARQLCAGIAEAHNSGILHRDLKCNNVMLCPEPDRAMRVVITDFGLASQLALPAVERGGTPAYMAPELWNGGQPSKASDIYALGVICYEMITGVRPCSPLPVDTGDASVRASTKSLSCPNPADKPIVVEPVPPPPPSARVKNLDPRWDKVIMGCLAPSPEHRTQDVSEVVWGLRKRPVSRQLVLTVALIIVALLSPFGLVRPLRDKLVEWVHPPNVRLAVLPVENSANTSIGDGVLQEALSRLAPMRAGRRNFALISPTTIRQQHIETPQQAREALHATHALQIALQQNPETTTAKVSLIDLQSNLPVREISVAYRPDELSRLPSALTAVVAAGLGLRQTTPPDSLAPAASAPYLRGLTMLHGASENSGEAILSFRQASALDPHSPLPLTGLVEAYIARFKTSRQVQDLELAQQALRSAQTINPDSVRVLLASGMLNETRGSYLKALDDYRRVQDLEPRNMDAALRIGDTYNQLDMPAEAVKAYMYAASLDPNYYEPYEYLGEFYYYRGKYTEAAEYFRQTIERAPGMFNAYTNLASALIELGSNDAAEKALFNSLKIRETARALNSLGAMRAYQHRDAEAVVYYSKALQYDPNELIYLVNIADSYRRLGRAVYARTAYAKGLEVAETELVQNPRLGRTRAYVGYFAARLGQTVRANQEIAQALAFAPTDSNVLRRAALTYEALGERDKAIAILHQATPALRNQVARHPDMADFSRDPRFRDQIASSGGS